MPVRRIKSKKITWANYWPVLWQRLVTSLKRERKGLAALSGSGGKPPAENTCILFGPQLLEGGHTMEWAGGEWVLFWRGRIVHTGKGGAFILTCWEYPRNIVTFLARFMLEGHWQVLYKIASSFSLKCIKIILPLLLAAFTIWQQSVPPLHFHLYLKDAITHTLHIESVLQWL